MTLITHLLTTPPLQALADERFAAAGLEVSVLRLDAMHPVLSGNKWLKIAPWLAKAREQQRVGIVAHGGPWSNFLHAAAYACQQVGLPFTALVQAPAHSATPTLADVVAWGGRLVFEPAFNADRELHWAQLAAQSRQLYIPLGGDGPEGVQGVADAFDALPLTGFTHVLCALGTGTTCLGIAASGLGFQQLMGINVGLPAARYQALERTMQQQYAHRHFTVLSHPELGKFGRLPQFLPPLMNHWAQTHGLPTDAVYTAKAFFLLQKLVQDGHFEPGSRLLLVHTGGLQGNRSLPAGSLSYGYPV